MHTTGSSERMAAYKSLLCHATRATQDPTEIQQQICAIDLSCLWCFQPSTSIKLCYLNLNI